MLLFFVASSRFSAKSVINVVCVLAFGWVPSSPVRPRFWFMDFVFLAEKIDISLSFWVAHMIKPLIDLWISWKSPKLERHCHTIWRNFHLLLLLLLMHNENSRAHSNQMNCIPSNQLFKCYTSEINRRAFIYGNQILSTKFLQNEFPKKRTMMNEKNKRVKTPLIRCTICLYFLFFSFFERIAFNSAKK